MEIGGNGKVMRMEGERLQSVVWRVILLPLSSRSFSLPLSLSHCLSPSLSLSLSLSLSNLNSTLTWLLFKSK